MARGKYLDLVSCSIPICVLSGCFPSSSLDWAPLPLTESQPRRAHIGASFPVVITEYRLKDPMRRAMWGGPGIVRGRSGDVRIQSREAFEASGWV